MHGQSAKGRLRALELRPSKRLSQSFLDEPGIAAAIVKAARLDPAEDVLEVGPGLGILTERLRHAARRVVAVEIDTRLADALHVQFDGANVEIHTADVLKVDPAFFFGAPFVVVANLPYHITSPALRHLLATGPPFASRLVVMVQAEVAARIAAPPGDLSALAVAIQAQARVRIIRRVRAAAFVPKPKVDSAVLLLEPLADPDRAIPRAEITDFVDLVHAGFKQPRKKLVNSLAEGLGSPKLLTGDLLARAQINPSLRPQELTVADWARLYRST
ncbi:MAG: 16S rRNA (adenine(1518)-N(6)/adenine(1519)-N(6))-dimethyltransferase RsmA [Chloroflexi bacterium]|nr:16S rRNA (adenine(1518)-N(6)/adenine(1519)-N(6))-dimethyltransferase RsmA [Chloroflexota bacterium]